MGPVCPLVAGRARNLAGRGGRSTLFRVPRATRSEHAVLSLVLASVVSGYFALAKYQRSASHYQRPPADTPPQYPVEASRNALAPLVAPLVAPLARAHLAD